MTSRRESCRIPLQSSKEMEGASHRGASMPPSNNTGQESEIDDGSAMSRKRAATASPAMTARRAKRSRTTLPPPELNLPQISKRQIFRGLFEPMSIDAATVMLKAPESVISPEISPERLEGSPTSTAALEGYNATGPDDSDGHASNPVSIHIDPSATFINGTEERPTPFGPVRDETPQADREEGSFNLFGQVLPSPSVSPLSTPPSSPTLNAQASSLVNTVPSSAESLPQPLNTKEPAEAIGDNGERSTSQTAVVSPTVTTQDDPVSTTDDLQNDKSITPGPKTQTQLPTPPSSIASTALEWFPNITSSGRSVRKPIKFGDMVETPPNHEDKEMDSNSDVNDPLPSKAAVTKAKARTKSRRAIMTTSRAKTASVKSKKIVSDSPSRVAKSRKGKTTEKLPVASTPAPRPRAGRKSGTPAGALSPKAEDVTPSLDANPSTSSASSKQNAKAGTSSKVTSKGQKLTASRSNTKAKSVTKKTTAIHKSMIVSLDIAPKLNIDPAKLKLSQKLSSREPLESKPNPVGKPEVWAESRQALCETLPYFKKPQGGCYSNDGHVYGFLFDGVGHCREYLDENLILCRAGGSMESDPSGGMVQKKDQTMTESQVQSVLNDMVHHNPLVVICGSRNVAARTKMPHQYSVLGWYKPTLVWAEKTAGKGQKVWTTIKYRLERLNQNSDPAWHAPNEGVFEVTQGERAIAGDLFTHECDYCLTESPQIYLQGWMCLNAACSQFWKLGGMDAPCGKVGLDYDPAFLLHRSEPWKGGGDEMEPVPGSLRPAPPNVGKVIGDNLFYINTRGMCCEKCGRCNSRRKFKGWECETCRHTISAEFHPVEPAMLHTPWDASPTLVRNRHAAGVHIEVTHLCGYKVSKYTFGDKIDGCFIHLAASKELLKESNGPNDMFKELQGVDMGLERRVFAVTKMSGASSDKTKGDTKEAQLTPTAPENSKIEDPTADIVTSQDSNETGEGISDKPSEDFAPGDLMTAFSMNYGMPYKFVASGGSQPFEAAPWPVTECRRRLNWAQKNFLGDQERYKDFNEQLIFAYLEGQKIEYHDDGESGLGPRIATLSLGGRAKMHMRMKAKHYVGCSKTGIFTEERPVPGSIDGDAMYQKRMKEWEELQKLKHDTVQYNRRRKEIPKELGIYEKKTKKADDLVTVTLSHGDIIIMDGYDIQKYLEHKVVPEGYLRFALTCRTVLPDHLKPEELPSYPVEEDPITYDGPKVSKDGSVT